VNCLYCMFYISEIIVNTIILLHVHAHAVFLFNESCTVNKGKCMNKWLTSVRMESTITNVPDLPMPALNVKEEHSMCMYM